MNRVIRRAPGRKRAVLSAETLEDRTVPSGNVTAFVSGGVLHVTGDDAANRIWVCGFGKQDAVITPLDDTTINGAHATVSVGGIAFAYDIHLNGGDDLLYVSGTQGDLAVFADMGAGDNGVAIDYAAHKGATVVNTGSGDNIVSLGMDKFTGLTAFNLGGGDDTINIAGSEFGDVVFSGGGGKNTMGLSQVNFHSTPLVFGFQSVFQTLMPVAVNDSAVVPASGSVTVNVAANDLAAVGTLNLSSVAITSNPAHGTVRVNGNGTVTYTADSSHAQTDSFRYTIRNSTGAVSNEATVTLLLGEVVPPDHNGPVPTISTSAGNPTNLASIPFTVTFDENVTGFDASDLSVTNGTASGFTKVSDRKFTFNVAPTADGTVTVNIAAGAAKDAAGNDSTAATKSIVSDRTAPTATITTTATDPTGTSPIPFTVTFSEAVTQFTASKVTVTNGTLSGFSGSGTTYTFNVTPTASGAVTVSVGQNAGFDSAGNGSSPATKTINFDNTHPSVTLSTNATSPTNANPIHFTATFSKSVTGFSTAGISVTNGTASNVAGSGMTWTFDVAPTADGTVTVTVNAGAAQDTAGNGNTASAPFSITSDRTAPTATIDSTAAPGPTATSPIPFTVTFSEAVTGFTAGDVIVTNGGVVNFSGTGANYTFGVVPNAPGPVDVSIGAGAAEDAATNGNAAAGPFTIVYNGTTVTATITSTEPDPTSSSPIPITVTFSEAVTGFDLSDVQVINGTASNFAGSGAVYTFDVTPSVDGPIVIDIPAGAATGTANNNPTSPASFTITSDRTRPTATVSTNEPNPTNANPITFTAHFSESVTGFSLGGIGVTGGTASNLQGSGADYTFDVTPTADGTVTATVNAGAAQDAAGNTSTASTPVSRTSDRTPPNVGINSTGTGAITGTASDASAVTGVQVSVFDPGTSMFWDWTTSTFTSPTEAFHAAGSTDNFATWRVDITATGGPFTVHAKATDAAGNVGEQTGPVTL